MLKEISNDNLTNYFAGQLTAVDVLDVFYLIHNDAIFSAQKRILGIAASRYVEPLWLKDTVFPFLTSSNSTLTLALSSLDTLSSV